MRTPRKASFSPRHHAIAFAGFLNISIPHVDDLIAVDLLHRNDASIVNTHGLLHIADILTDDLGVVADAVRNIKPGVRSDALAPTPSHKAVQQSFIFFPLRNLEPREFHD